jgi:hypothetical protein
MEDPLLTDQQIENGIDWTPRSTNSRAMTPHAVRAFYEEQISKDRALVQALVNALEFERMNVVSCQESVVALSMAWEQMSIAPTDEHSPYRRMINWNNGGPEKDDFTAKVNGYALRVEQMNKHTWWWQVYYPDGTMANPGCDLDLPSERVAKRICEIIYELHRKG